MLTRTEAISQLKSVVDLPSIALLQSAEKAELIAEYSWEVFDHVYGIARVFPLDHIHNTHLIHFARFFVERVPAKEILLLLSEKMSRLRSSKTMSLLPFDFCCFVMQLILLKSSDLRTEGLALLVSATSEVITKELKLQKGRLGTEDGCVATGNNVFVVLDTALHVFSGVVSGCNDWIGDDAAGGVFGGISDSEMYYQDMTNKTEATGIALMFASECIAQLRLPQERGSYLHKLVTILSQSAIRPDWVKIFEFPRSMQSFIYSYYSFMSLQYNSPVSRELRLEHKRREKARMKGQQQMGKTGGDEDDLESRLNMGICGSGLGDGSDMTEYTGLERALFYANKDPTLKVDTQALLQEYALEQSPLLRAADLVPLKCISDTFVENCYEHLKEWQETFDKREDAQYERHMASYTKRSEGPKRVRVTGPESDTARTLLESCEALGLCGYAQWPLLGCSLLFHFLMHEYVHNGSSTQEQEAKESPLAASYGVEQKVRLYDDSDVCLLALPSLCPYSNNYLFTCGERFLLPLVGASAAKLQENSSPQKNIQTCEALSLLLLLSPLSPIPAFTAVHSSQKCFLPSLVFETVVDDTPNAERQAAVTSYQRKKQVMLGSSSRKRAFGLNSIVSYQAYRSNRGSSDIKCRALAAVAHCCAQSSDALAQQQGLISAITQCDHPGRQRSAYFAIVKRLRLYEERSLYLLLRQIVLTCPHQQVAGLLVDSVKSAVQAASSHKGHMYGMRLSEASGSSSTSSSIGSLMGVLHKNVTLGHTRTYLGEITEYTKQGRFGHSNKEREEAEVNASRAEAREEALVLLWTETSPFWSPLVLYRYGFKTLDVLVEFGSSGLLENLEVIKAGLALLQFVLTRILWAKRGNTDANSAEQDLAWLWKTFFQWSDQSIHSLLHDKLTAATKSVQELQARREKQDSDGNDTRIGLELQLLSMTLSHLQSLVEK